MGASRTPPRAPRFALLAAIALLLAPALAPAQTVDPAAAFHQLLDRPSGPPGFQALTEKLPGGLILEKGTFHSDASTLVPYLVVKPDKVGPLPAVIVLHGTGGQKERMRSTLDDLAKRGFLTVAI